jgi:predicted esterase
MALRLHETQPVLHAGAPLSRAKVAVVLMHGRGASADDILSLHDEFDVEDVAYLAPSALNNTWYPFSFLAPIARNQPFLDSALNVVTLLLEEIRNAGIGPEHTVLAGFSQGACLALEYAARHAQRLGGVIGLSGGVIGPDDTPRDYPGTFRGTPVYLGCSDIDPHIPLPRVQQTAALYRKMGAEVTEQIFRDGGHTVFPEEIVYVDNLIRSLAG